MLVFLVPDVLLNVTAKATGNSSIHVTWKVERIHPQLNTPGLYQVSYMYCQNKQPQCTGNFTSKATALTKELKNLLIFVKYEIRVKAVNITAKDGTEVRISEGNYSMPAYATTDEGGDKYFLGCFLFFLWSLFFILTFYVSDH